jgi:hypothetical protein
MTCLAGCLLVAAGAGAGAGVATYAYLDGELKAPVEAPLDATYAAAQKAVRELEYRVKSETKDANDAQIVAEKATDTEVEIRLERWGDKATRVSIRVGVFGDEAESLMILDRIKAKL